MLSSIAISFLLWSDAVATLLLRCQCLRPDFAEVGRSPDAAFWEQYDGKSRDAVYLAVKGRVFDVSSGSEFYGPDGGSYNALAGHDASRALGIMSLQGRDKWVEDCCIRRIDDLGHKQYKVMREWEDKYVEKYPIVGVLLGHGTVGGIDFVPVEGGPVEQLIQMDQFHWADGPKGAAEAACRALEEAAREHTIMWPQANEEQEKAEASMVAGNEAQDDAGGSATVGTSTAKRRSSKK